MASPVITCLMCVYNGESFLREAINSILNQTFKDFELVIINDASIDSTLEILNSFTDNRIKIITNSHNLGLTKSLNIGIKHSKGKYIARMDADDVSRRDRFEKQLKFILKHHEIAVVFSFGNGFLSRKYPKSPIKNHEIKARLLFENPLVHSSAFINKNLIGNNLYYDEDYKTSQDYELWCRLSFFFKFHVIPYNLIQFRKHENQVSKTNSLNQRQNFEKIQNNYAGKLNLILTQKDWVIIRRVGNVNESTNQYLQQQAENVFNELYNQLVSQDNEYTNYFFQEFCKWWNSILYRSRKHRFAMIRKWLSSPFFSLKQL